MSAVLRACLVLVLIALGGLALLYAVAAAPASVRGEVRPPAFAWTAADRDCFEAYEQCHAEALIRLAPAAPLSPRPLAMQLVREIVAGRVLDSEELARQVLARDPRSRDARQVLAATALSRGEVEAFLTVFLPLFDVDRVQSAAYADYLAGLSTDARVRAALMPRLAESPAWATAYLNALARRGGLSLGEVIPLYRMVPGAQPALLARLARDGQWDAAYIAFMDFAGQAGGAAAAGLSVPFNPDLAEHPAPAPFNWTLPSRSAQFLPGGGVYVFYEGRRAQTLLSQVFPLSPGDWELAVQASGQTAETGGSFRWQIACATGGPPLGQFDMDGLKAAPSRTAWAFDLAAGSCPYLALSLRGVPGAFPQPARIEVVSVRLMPAGSQGQGP